MKAATGVNTAVVDMTDGAIKDRAAEFAKDHENDTREESHKHLFWQDFFKVFGINIRDVAQYESPVRKAGGGTGFIDVFWPGKIIIEHKSLGKDLDNAVIQAAGYREELTMEQQPRYLLACDFRNWLLKDKKYNSEYRFKLEDLPAHTGLFNFLIGKPMRVEQHPMNAKAAELMSRLYDSMGVDTDPNVASHFLTRLAFCLFADDTGIFESNGAFENSIKTRTREDGSDLSMYLAELFKILDQDPGNRKPKLGADLKKYPYINGRLFGQKVDVPALDADDRALILEACAYDWGKVSPAIFGTMFQSIMDEDKRATLGAHYTSEVNIMRVINPLFLDGLRAKFEEANAVRGGHRRARLEAFQDKLASLRFLDPACGSGNFLIVAYREIRRLEHRVIRQLYGRRGEEMDGREEMDAIKITAASKVDVHQFYGIEKSGFSRDIAEVSMWIMDHMMNLELSEAYGLPMRRIPIRNKPAIVRRDALEFDWNDLVKSEDCDYVFGNPPYLGSAMVEGKDAGEVEFMKNQTRRITGSGKLDYCANWFVKGAKYLDDCASMAFVATNSITQGEQVELLWTQVIKDGLDIEFAYRQFVWDSEAQHKANVIVVIVGLSKKRGVKRLFDLTKKDTLESNPGRISPYLESGAGGHAVVSNSPQPLNGLPLMCKGSVMIDGGHTTFTESEKDEFLKIEPGAEKWFVPYYAAYDLLHNRPRYILKLQKTPVDQLKKMTHVMARLKQVTDYRLQSSKKTTQRLSKKPVEWGETRIPKSAFIVLPRVSSEKRDYLQADFMEPPVIPSDALCFIDGADLAVFGLVSSNMHMVWTKKYAGRLKSDYRYSVNLVYNTFPLPDAGTAALDALESRAQAVLDARAAHPGQTLADLYDPLAMPADLRRAHEKLDKAVDRLYRKESFKDDRERLEFLLERYGTMVQNNQKLVDRERRRR